MKIEILNNKKGKMSFLLENSTPFFANALRRTVMNEVPTMAIEDVEFRKNSSVLYDEMIAHRMGLVPLKTDLKSYNEKLNCTCKSEGCAKCQVVGTLKAKGPGIIMSSELKFKDPAIKPAFSDMPIVKLLKGQELECEVTAELGRGKEHSKWIPAHIFYKYKPDVVIGKVKDPEAVAKVCPVNVFEVKGGKLAIKDLYACHLCGACVDEEPEGIKLNEDGKSFLFYIESFGQLDCKETISKAVEILGEQLGEFEKAL